METLQSDLVIVMPAYNEESGIQEFIIEIADSFPTRSPIFVVVDDQSSDQTVEALIALRARGLRIKIETNEKNVGHGPSMLRALHLGLESSTQTVISVDGDGQFHGTEIAILARLHEEKNLDVVEGVRQNRSEPSYRRLMTQTTRFLVWSRCRSVPRDANTPLRVYSIGALQRIVNTVPADFPVPSLAISVLTRKAKMHYEEVRVSSLPRRGKDVNGVTFGKPRRLVPPKKLILFCAKSLGAWVTFKPQT